MTIYNSIVQFKILKYYYDYMLLICIDELSYLNDICTMSFRCYDTNTHFAKEFKSLGDHFLIKEVWPLSTRPADIRYYLFLGKSNDTIMHAAMSILH